MKHGVSRLFLWWCPGTVYLVGSSRVSESSWMFNAYFNSSPSNMICVISRSDLWRAKFYLYLVLQTSKKTNSFVYIHSKPCVSHQNLLTVSAQISFRAMGSQPIIFDNQSLVFRQWLLTVGIPLPFYRIEAVLFSSYLVTNGNNSKILQFSKFCGCRYCIQIFNPFTFNIMLSVSNLKLRKFQNLWYR